MKKFLVLYRSSVSAAEQMAAATPEQAQAGMDAGRRWMLSDVSGKPLYAWDDRDHRVRTAYDVLRRPTGSFVRDGADAVPAGTGLFTLLGFAGLYLFVGILYLMLLARIIARGPEDLEPPTTSTAAAAASA